MIRELIVNATPDKVDIALLEDKEVVEIHHEKGDKQFNVGDIYLGRVNKIVTGLNAAFIDVGYERDAFLHYTDLGPQIRSLNKVLKQSIAGALDDVLLNNLRYEPEIVKTGKIDEVLNKKQSILIQVLKEPISTKGPRLTCEISLPGRYLVLLPFNQTVGVSKRIASADERKRLLRLIESIRPKNFGVVVRTVAEGKSVADLHEDMNDLVEKWKQSIKQLKGAVAPVKIHGELRKTSSILRDLLNDSFNNIVVNDAKLAEEITTYIVQIAPDKKNIVNHYRANKPLFDTYGITKQIKSLFGKTVTIPGGSYLVVEHTEALHVIDVNSGHKMAKGLDQEATALKVNLGAAKEVARQLRLRDIGGIIVIDFIDQKKPDNRKALYNKMKELMKNDRARHTILPLSKFGIMQITRERTRPEVSIKTGEVCPTCSGSGKIEASILIEDELQRDLEYVLENNSRSIKLFAHPFIAAYIKKGFPSMRFNWWRKYKRWISVYPNGDYHLTEYHFFDKNTEEEILLT